MKNYNTREVCRILVAECITKNKINMKDRLISCCFFVAHTSN